MYANMEQMALLRQLGRLGAMQKPDPQLFFLVMGVAWSSTGHQVGIALCAKLVKSKKGAFSITTSIAVDHGTCSVCCNWECLITSAGF